MKPVISILSVLISLTLISCGKVIPDRDPTTVKMNLTVSSEKWVTVPAGPFKAGLSEHEVIIEKPFEIMVTEVTYLQYSRYLNEALAAKKIEIRDKEVFGFYKGDAFNKGRHEIEVPAGKYKYYDLGGQKCRINFDGTTFTVTKGYENFPVAYVSWMGAQAYALHYGWRLPLEEEWEKAARGTDGRSYPFKEEPTPHNANFYHSGDPFDKSNGTTPVGFYNGKTHGDFHTEDSPSPYGCYDMAGNVAEWMGTIIKGSHLRHIFGGSMVEYDFNLRSWTENSGMPWYTSHQVGFRCARNVR